MPGRHIGVTIFLRQLLPDALGALNKQGAIAFLDFQKAYDTVDREFLFSVMGATGAGGGMLSWARALLTDTSAVAVVNGHVSKPQLWEAGVRQGCPLAPAMYLFVAWALNCWLRAQPPEAVGVQVLGTRMVCGQYADDTSPFLRGWGETHVQVLQDAMRVFSAASGQWLNLGKCKLLPLGCTPAMAATLPEQVCGMQVVRQAETLGILFADRQPGQPPPSVDWEQRLRAVEASYSKLARLPLSMFGRAYAAASYGISQLLHHAEFAEVPEQVVERLRKMTVKLVDRGLAPLAPATTIGKRLPGVPSSLLVGQPSAGGVGMLAWQQHIRARHAVWAFRLLVGLTSSDPPLWVLAAKAILRRYLPNTAPALAFWHAGQTASSQMDLLKLGSSHLERLITGIRALGQWVHPVPSSLPTGSWCAEVPIWANPLLRLEWPSSNWGPTHELQVMTALGSELAEAAQAPAAQARETRPKLRPEVQEAMQRRLQSGYSLLSQLHETRTPSTLLALIQRLWTLSQRLAQERRRRGWAPLDSGLVKRALVAAVRPSTGGNPDALGLVNKYLVTSLGCYDLLLEAEALWFALPRAWRNAAVNHIQHPPARGPSKAQLEVTATIYCLRSLGWPAQGITSLPKALQGERLPEFLAHGSHSPQLYTPQAFTSSPYIQLFEQPLPLTVRLGTRLQLAGQPAVVQAALRQCVEGALSLGGFQPSNQEEGAAQITACLTALPARMKQAWSLRWENQEKEIWWRLLLGGVPGAGGHGIMLKGPCPCGWAVPAHLCKEAGAAAQRDHVFWQCAPAQAVRRALAHNLPEGTQLQPRHLWLLEPPCPEVHPGVWMVVGMAALTVLQSARKYMWAKHKSNSSNSNNNNRQQQQRRRAAARRQQPGQREAAMLTPAPVAAAMRAVARLAAALGSFADLGHVPKGWRGSVSQTHPFLALPSAQATRLTAELKTPEGLVP